MALRLGPTEFIEALPIHTLNGIVYLSLRSNWAASGLDPCAHGNALTTWLCQAWGHLTMFYIPLVTFTIHMVAI